MNPTLERGEQIRLHTVAQDEITAAFQAYLAQLSTDISTIYINLSTDQEQADAIASVTAAWNEADGSLQTTLASMVAAAKAGIGIDGSGNTNMPSRVAPAANTPIANAVAALDALIASEVSAFADALSAEEAALASALSSEASARTSAISAESSTRVTAETALQALVTAEEARAEAAEGTLQSTLTIEIAARNTLNTTLSAALLQESASLGETIAAEAADRAAADNTLQSNLNAIAISRTTTDNAHTASISAAVVAREAAVTSEASTRTAADAALDDRIVAVANEQGTALTLERLIVREHPVGAIDGVNTAYALTHVPHLGSEHLFVDGLLREPSGELPADYTISGGAILLTQPILGGVKLVVNYYTRDNMRTWAHPIAQGQLTWPSNPAAQWGSL